MGVSSVKHSGLLCCSASPFFHVLPTAEEESDCELGWIAVTDWNDLACFAGQGNRTVPYRVEIHVVMYLLVLLLYIPGNGCYIAAAQGAYVVCILLKYRKSSDNVKKRTIQTGPGWRNWGNNKRADSNNIWKLHHWIQDVLTRIKLQGMACSFMISTSSKTCFWYKLSVITIPMLYFMAWV